MPRDVTKLEVFHLADALVIDVYGASRSFPADERYGLRGQLRRAAVSTANNLVEGCARRTTRDYLRFVETSLASASEARYLITVAGRLGFLASESARRLESRYERVVRSLQNLLNSLEHEP